MNSKSDTKSFSKVIKSKKDPNLKAIFRQASKEEIPRLAEWTAKVAKAYDPWANAVGVTESDLIEGYLIDMADCLKCNVLLVLENLANKEIIFVFGCKDIYTGDPNNPVSFFYHSHNEADNAFHDYFMREFIPKIKVPRGPLECFYLVFTMTNPKYKMHGFAENCSVEAMFHHPVLSKGDIFTESVSEKSIIVSINSGFKTLKAINFLDFKKVLGDVGECFTKIPEISERLGFPKGFYKECHYMYLERNPKPRL